MHPESMSGIKCIKCLLHMKYLYVLIALPLYTIDFGIIFRTGLCGFFLMFYKNYTHVWASQVALVVKNLPAGAGDRSDVG